MEAIFMLSEHGAVLVSFGVVGRHLFYSIITEDESDPLMVEGVGVKRVIGSWRLTLMISSISGTSPFIVPFESCCSSSAILHFSFYLIANSSNSDDTTTLIITDAIINGIN